MIDYYTYDSETKRLERAKRLLMRDGQAIILGDPADFARYLGAYPAAAESDPVPPEGKIAVADGWELSDDEWHRVFRYEDAPAPVPRAFSKYKIVRALQSEGVWEQVKAWIESTPGAYDLFLAAEDISEDEPLLADGIAAVKQLLGWTDEQVQAVLDASVKSY